VSTAVEEVCTTPVLRQERAVFLLRQPVTTGLTQGHIGQSRTGLRSSTILSPSVDFVISDRDLMVVQVHKWKAMSIEAVGTRSHSLVYHTWSSET